MTIHKGEGHQCHLYDPELNYNAQLRSHVGCTIPGVNCEYIEISNTLKKSWSCEGACIMAGFVFDIDIIPSVPYHLSWQRLCQSSSLICLCCKILCAIFCNVICDQ